MSSKIPSKVIYIGSIPYDQTEEQVLDIARSIGPVVNMKMMFDKDSGKSKGFAFVEYHDIETASSAVRNLNNYNIGPRQLKCDFSTEQSLANSNNLINLNGKSRKDELPPLPLGINLNNETFAESISNTLRNLDSTRLTKLVDDSIAMSKKNPVLMEELLSQCPQLSYALVEALLTNNRISPDQVTGLLINRETKDEEIIQEELDDEKISLIKQVLEISDDDLKNLPEDQRNSILEIKQNYANGVYGTL